MTYCTSLHLYYRKESTTNKQTVETNLCRQLKKTKQSRRKSKRQIFDAYETIVTN